MVVVTAIGEGKEQLPTVSTLSGLPELPEDPLGLFWGFRLTSLSIAIFASSGGVKTPSRCPPTCGHGYLTSLTASYSFSDV
jgi:hypothetical protein